MRYRTYPDTDLKVSEIGFGVWTVSTNWWGVTDDALRQRLLRTAYETHGINFFDTGDTYGDGLGETILRDVLGDVRDRIVLATKFGYDIHVDHDRPGHRERPQNWTPPFIRKACEESLQRLGTDRIDLYQMHNPRLSAIQSDDVIATLEDLKQAGKIRFYGTALGPALMERQIEEGRVSFDLGYHSVQIIYNLLEQILGEPVFEKAREHKGGVLVRVPHTSGLLEGNLTADTVFPPGDHRSHRPKEWLTEGLKKVEALDFLLRDGQRTIGQAALKFVLAEPTVMSAFPNIYNEEQLAEFAAAPGTPDLSEDELAQIASLYAENFGVVPTNA